MLEDPLPTTRGGYLYDLVSMATHESTVQFDNFKVRTCLLCIHVYMLVWRGSCKSALIGEHVLLEVVSLMPCLSCHADQAPLVLDQCMCGSDMSMCLGSLV